MIGLPIKSSFRILPESDVIYVSQQAKKEFLAQLERHGLTVIPEFQKKWWKCI